MTSIFHIEGGIGKHIAATGVINAYKKQNPEEEIIVVCAWVEIFIHNPNISKVFAIGNTPYFYRDYIHDKDCKIFAQEPYKQTSHITKSKPLIDTWCDLIGIDPVSSEPTLHLTQKEMEVSRQLFTRGDKPVLLFQPFGGAGQHSQPAKYSWSRDIHPSVAQKLVDILSHKFDIIHVCYDHHPILNNCLRLDQQISKNALFGLLLLADKRLLIDSSLQHAAKALNLPSVVQWIVTDPDVFGYDLHTNLKPKTSYPLGGIDSYLYDYNFGGSIHECPYASCDDIFDIQAIVNAVQAS